MEIRVTARRFKPQKEIRDHALASVRKLDKFCDRAARGDIILSFVHTVNSVMCAEINLHLDGAVLTAKDTSEDFKKSIDLAVAKLERQLAKRKTKLRMKNKIKLRRVKEDSISPPDGEEE